MTWTAYSERFERNGILADLDRHAAERRRYRMLIFVLATALGLLQICLAGYALGVGNQTIQIPYLKHLIDPQLYAQDPAIVGTLDAYPSYAYRILAYICALIDYQIVYAALHIICSACLFGGLLYASLYLFNELWAGLCACLLVLVGQQHALAGADIYCLGFSHTWISVPWMLWVFVLFWRQNFVLSGISLGLLFNIHALNAAYTALFIAAAFTGLYSFRHYWRLVLLAACACLCALPTLIDMFHQQHLSTAQWFDLMYVRSAQHSFPASLWREGDDSIVRFLRIVLLAALGYPYIRDPFYRRMAAHVLGCFAVLLLIGWFATDSATVLRAQLWRCSGLFLLLSCLFIGTALVNAWREKGGLHRLWAIAYTAGFLCAAIPGVQGLLNPILLFLIIVSLVLGIVTWQSALLIGFTAATVVLAYFFCGIPLLSSVLETQLHWHWQLSVVVALALAVVLSCLWRLGKPDAKGFVVQVNISTLALAIGFLFCLLCMLERPDNPWTDVQRWVKENTAHDAIIASPNSRSGFRIDSERSLVGEWRDGTQLYFNPAFTEEWWQRMCALELNLSYTPDAKTLVKRGQAYEFARDKDLLSMALEWQVGYLVLPQARVTELQRVYHNSHWQICIPELKPLPPAPDYVKQEDAWRSQQAFMRQVVEPNIQRFRTAQLQLQVLDQDGRPVKDLQYTLELQNHAFGFGSGLPFFKPHENVKRKDFSPPLVKEVDLSHFKQVFNYSTIPYSAKWFYTEPKEGEYYYDDLDAYVEWCTENQIKLEFHFITGYEPDWMKAKSKDERKAALIKHTHNMIDRYGDRIENWQVVNEKLMLKESVEAFKIFRERLPQAKLGISDCARFFSEKEKDSAKRSQDLLRGMNEVKWLRTQGVNLDFFAFHAHRPFGLWADLRVLYETLDAFRDEGVRIHISEFGMHENHEILGDIRGGKWDSELQGDYYAMIYKACFSHPAVDVVNIWGSSANTWMTGSGIVDKDGNPKPAFHKLKQLIHEELHTRESGVLPVHGRLSHRIFYGDYRLTLIMADGESLVVPFRIDNQSPLDWQLRLDLKGKTCLAVEPRRD